MISITALYMLTLREDMDFNSRYNVILSDVIATNIYVGCSMAQHVKSHWFAMLVVTVIAS